MQRNGDLVRVALLLLCAGVALASETPKRPNVLFICVDDLRPQLRCAGASFMQTPHLDRLAATGRLFLRHYVQVPTCGASRYSMWTGRYPEEPAALGNGAFTLMHGEHQEPESLAHLFHQNGYRTISIGKVSHSPDGRRFSQSGEGDGEPEMPQSWTALAGPVGRWGQSWDAFFGYASGHGRTRGVSPPFESADVDDHGYPDALIADAACDALVGLNGEPFFLAVGFFKPHLPFNSPKAYWDLYDPEALPPTPAPAFPGGVERRWSGHGGGELFGNYGGHPEDRSSPEYARRLRHAYSAAISYVDAQIGRVLQKLEDEGLADETIIVVWGDHGWHLGDLDLWGKHTLFEWSLRSALIMRVPSQERAGIATRTIVESVDLYPTLAELCGLSCPEDLDGESFASVIHDPRATTDGKALGYWRKGRARGRTVRTDRFRYTEWKRNGEVLQIELYDDHADPHETTNVADRRADDTERLHLELLR